MIGLSFCQDQLIVQVAQVKTDLEPISLGRFNQASEGDAMFPCQHVAFTFSLTLKRPSEILILLKSESLSVKNIAVPMTPEKGKSFILPRCSIYFPDTGGSGEEYGKFRTGCIFAYSHK